MCLEVLMLSCKRWVRNAVLMNILYISKVQTRGKRAIPSKKIKKENPCRRRTGVEVSGLNGLKHVTFKTHASVTMVTITYDFFFFSLWTLCPRGFQAHRSKLYSFTCNLGAFRSLFFSFFFLLFSFVLRYSCLWKVPMVNMEKMKSNRRRKRS